jgi:hypothetical protein
VLGCLCPSGRAATGQAGLVVLWAPENIRDRARAGVGAGGGAAASVSRDTDAFDRLARIASADLSAMLASRLSSD